MNDVYEYRGITHPNGWGIVIKVQRSITEPQINKHEELLLWQADEIERLNARVEELEQANMKRINIET